MFVIDSGGYVGGKAFRWPSDETIENPLSSAERSPALPVLQQVVLEPGRPALRSGRPRPEGRPGLGNIVSERGVAECNHFVAAFDEDSCDAEVRRRRTAAIPDREQVLHCAYSPARAGLAGSIGAVTINCHSDLRRVLPQ